MRHQGRTHQEAFDVAEECSWLGPIVRKHFEVHARGSTVESVGRRLVPPKEYALVIEDLAEGRPCLGTPRWCRKDTVTRSLRSQGAVPGFEEVKVDLSGPPDQLRCSLCVLIYSLDDEDATSGLEAGFPRS